MTLRIEEQMSPDVTMGTCVGTPGQQDHWALWSGAGAYMRQTEPEVPCGRPGVSGD